MKSYIVGLNFEDFIDAENEEEAKEKFSDMYDINPRHLSAHEIGDVEEGEAE